MKHLHNHYLSINKFVLAWIDRRRAKDKCLYAVVWRNAAEHFETREEKEGKGEEENVVVKRRRKRRRRRRRQSDKKALSFTLNYRPEG